jgi:hypothetical protein
VNSYKYVLVETFSKNVKTNSIELIICTRQSKRAEISDYVEENLLRFSVLGNLRHSVGQPLQHTSITDWEGLENTLKSKCCKNERRSEVVVDVFMYKYVNETRLGVP